MTIRSRVAALVLVAAWVIAGCNKQEGGPGAEAQSAPVDSVTVPTVIGDSAKIMLKFRVKPGESFKYRVTLHSESEGVFNERKSQYSEDSRYDFTMRFETPLNDSVMRATFTVDSIHMDMNGPTGKKTFYSSDSIQMHDPEYALYASLVQTPVPMKISSRGDIIEIDSIEGIADRVIAAQTSKTQMAPNTRDILITQIRESGIKLVVQHVFTHFGDEPVSKSGTWTLPFKSAAEMFPTENVVTYTLSDLAPQKDARTASITSRLGVKVTQERLEDSTAVLTLNSSSFSALSNAVIDLDRGISKHKESRMQVAMDVSVRGRGSYQKQAGADIKKTMLYEATLDRR